MERKREREREREFLSTISTINTVNTTMLNVTIVFESSRQHPWRETLFPRSRIRFNYKANDLRASDRRKIGSGAAVNPKFMKRSEGRLFADAWKPWHKRAGDAYCHTDVDRNEISLRLLPPTRRIRIKLACQTCIFTTARYESLGRRRRRRSRRSVSRAPKSSLRAESSLSLPLPRPRETWSSNVLQRSTAFIDIEVK